VVLQRARHVSVPPRNRCTAPTGQTERRKRSALKWIALRWRCPPIASLTGATTWTQMDVPSSPVAWLPVKGWSWVQGSAPGIRSDRFWSGNLATKQTACAFLTKAPQAGLDLPGPGATWKRRRARKTWVIGLSRCTQTSSSNAWGLMSLGTNGARAWCTATIWCVYQMISLNHPKSLQRCCVCCLRILTALLAWSMVARGSVSAFTAAVFAYSTDWSTQPIGPQVQYPANCWI